MLYVLGITALLERAHWKKDRLQYYVLTKKLDKVEVLCVSALLFCLYEQQKMIQLVRSERYAGLYRSSIIGCVHYAAHNLT